MAIAFVNSVAIQALSAAATITSPSFASTNGNFLAVNVGDNPDAVSSVTDSAGNTYTLAVGPTSTGAGTTLEQHYTTNIVGAAGHTVTAALSPDSIATLWVLQASGIATTAPLDQVATDVDTGVTSFLSPAVTTTQADELLIGAFCHDGGTATISAGGSFTLTNPQEDSCCIAGSAEYRIVAATGSYQSSFSYAGSATNAVNVFATYKAAAGGGRTTKNTRSHPLGVEIGMGWRMPV